MRFNLEPNSYIAESWAQVLTAGTIPAAEPGRSAGKVEAGGADGGQVDVRIHKAFNTGSLVRTGHTR